MKLRYPQSGLAMQATSRSALRPRRFPISPRVARSGSDNRNRDGSFDRRIRFSAARYSFCGRVSWFTEPVTYAGSRTDFLFLMPTACLTRAKGAFSFLDHSRWTIENFRRQDASFNPRAAL